MDKDTQANGNKNMFLLQSFFAYCFKGTGTFTSVKKIKSQEEVTKQ
jgi:hypothetical protein